jgi:ribonuclease D
MTIHLHKGDLPANITFPDIIAVDSETMGLIPARDQLCLVQISGGDGQAHIVQLNRETYDAPNLKRILSDTKTTKIFHFARFDVRIIKKYLGVETGPVFCTRTASKLVRTYTDKHGLRDCCKALLDIEINKQQQSSDWGAKELTEAQLLYAATDVLHLHALKEKFDTILARENRTELAKRCFDCISLHAELDEAGWDGINIFEH